MGGQSRPEVIEVIEELASFLADTVVREFAFFERAVPALDEVGDEELAAVVEGEYAAWFDQQSRLYEEEGRGANGNAVDNNNNRNHDSVDGPGGLLASVVWRTHMLRPLVYAQAQAQAQAQACHPPLFTGGGGLEDESNIPVLCCPPFGPLGLSTEALVAAVRRQEAFMRKMMVGRAVFETAESIESSVGEYLSFLARAGQANGAPLVPTVMVDLVWHVHQQRPRRYGEDCLSIAGRLVNHDDDPVASDSVISVASAAQ